MWWTSKLDKARDELIAVLKLEIQALRQRHDTDRERVDRLMEALARKANVDLIMPMPTPPPVEKVYVANPWKDPNAVTDVFPEQSRQRASGAVTSHI